MVGFWLRFPRHPQFSSFLDVSVQAPRNGLKPFSSPA